MPGIFDLDGRVSEYLIGRTIPLMVRIRAEICAAPAHSCHEYQPAARNLRTKRGQRRRTACYLLPPQRIHLHTSNRYPGAGGLSFITTRRSTLLPSGCADEPFQTATKPSPLSSLVG